MLLAGLSLTTLPFMIVNGEAGDGTGSVQPLSEERVQRAASRVAAS